MNTSPNKPNEATEAATEPEIGRTPDEALRDAQLIVARDPVTGQRTVIYGQDVVQRMKHGESVGTTVVIEVSVPSENIPGLMERIRTAKLHGNSNPK